MLLEFVLGRQELTLGLIEASIPTIYERFLLIYRDSLWILHRVCEVFDQVKSIYSHLEAESCRLADPHRMFRR